MCDILATVTFLQLIRFFVLVVFLQRDILATWHFYNESVKPENTIAESLVIG